MAKNLKEKLYQVVVHVLKLTTSVMSAGKWIKTSFVKRNLILLINSKRIWIAKYMEFGMNHLDIDSFLVQVAKVEFGCLQKYIIARELHLILSIKYFTHSLHPNLLFPRKVLVLESHLQLQNPSHQVLRISSGQQLLLVCCIMVGL
jgi:hypothetical protein